MIADLSKMADFSSKISSYSHEAKVNKWLAEQTSLIPEQPLASDYLTAPRRRRPRVDPSLLDWKKLTGDENVSVINRLTGKKMTGNKAPQLRRLAQWLVENPMFDVDPKWAELVKERGNLPHDLQKRVPANERKKGPGRPPLLSSPPGHQPSVSQPNLGTSVASSIPFPSLATAGLSGLSAAGLNPSSILSGLSLGGFDPKNNPLLLPFSGMPNMSALGSMSGLGNLNNMNLTNSLFANLANLGLPSLAGMDGSDLGVVASGSATKSKNRKPTDAERSHSTTKPPPVSSASSSIPSSALPFFFPNPSLLYTPLGLGGLNPFSMQPGSMSSAYDSLAQQCGLLNGSLGVSGVSTSTSASSSTRTGSHKTQSTSRATTVTSSSPSNTSSHRHQRSSTRDILDRAQQQQLQQLLLPHDTHLLESLSRVHSAESVFRNEKRSRESDRKESVDPLRGEKRSRDAERKDVAENLSKNPQVDYSFRAEDRPLKKLKTELERKDSAESLTPNFVSNLLPHNEEWLKRSCDVEMKDTLENLYRVSVDAVDRDDKINKKSCDTVTDREVLESFSNVNNVCQSEERSKISNETDAREVENVHDPPPKNNFDTVAQDVGDCAETETAPIVAPASDVSVDRADTQSEAVDASNVVLPLTVQEEEKEVSKEIVDSDDKSITRETASPCLKEQPVPLTTDADCGGNVADSSIAPPLQTEEVTPTLLPEPEHSPLELSKPQKAATATSNNRRSRSAKKTKEVGETVNVERKVLRSSAGRAAAAAAARAAAAAAAAAAASAIAESSAEHDTVEDGASEEKAIDGCGGSTGGPSESEET